ncbi:MAG: EAL domain-containing protein [Sphaerochaeta sp.]
MQLQRKTVTNIVRYILVFVLPVIFIIHFLMDGYETSLREQVALRIQAEQERGTLVISNQIENAFTQFASDLLVVHNSNEMRAYREQPGEATLNEVANLLVRISSQKAYILHQRLIDNTGILLAQADTDASRSVALMDQSTPTYLGLSEVYTQTRELAPGVLYISPITLQREGNPMLTLALPIYQGSRILGIIAIDFDACYLFSFLSVYQSSLMKDLDFQVIDHQGRVVLVGERGCSSLYPEGRNLFREEPAIQDFLSREVLGSYVSDRKAYTFQAIYPRSNEKLFYSTSPNWLWTVVSSYERSQLSLLTEDFLLSHPAVKYFLSLGLLLIGAAAVVIMQIRAQDKQQLRISSLIADYATNGVVVYDMEGRLTFCNQAFEELIGDTQDRLKGKRATSLRFGLPSFQLSNTEMSQPVWVFHKENHRTLCAMHTAQVGGKRGQEKHTIEIYSPSIWETMELLEHCKEHQLTYEQCFAKTLQLPKDSQQYVCLMVHFLNSKEIGMRLNQRERVVFSNRFATTLAKVVGTVVPILSSSFDSYLVFVRTTSSVSEIERVVASLLAGFHLPYLFGQLSLSLNISVGISLYPEPSANLYALVSDAAVAMHMATPTNDHGYLFYSEKVAMHYQRKKMIREALVHVFETDQLYLVYQPQVSVKSGVIVGAEALIRWNHPELGSIFPDEFLPLIHELSLTELLGKFVIEQAITFLHTHRRLLENHSPAFTLSINLSADELGNTHLTDLLVSELKRLHIPISMMAVELTEHTAVESLSNTTAIMERLHSNGISLAIDDFGTGFSSLSYLLELPADMIKIDRSFISRYPDSESITIYRTVLLMAKEMGAVVLAEGVETEKQLEFLSIIGCDYYQGYLFSRPVDEQRFLMQLQEKNRAKLS